MPTIGQLFKYSLLVLPKKHIECMAQLSNKEIFDLELLIQKTKIKLSEFGNVIVFEHGAHKETGGSCGIYHAHIHIVPVPSELDLSDFFYTESVVKKYDSLIECYSDLRGSSQYLMALNPDGSIYATDTSNIIHQYPSQFFRKKLVEYYNLDKPWNWREYLKVEKNVLQTIDEVHS
jgi:diadenosine tetraphosphate (Ap4A) HIT family hydrolase